MHARRVRQLHSCTRWPRLDACLRPGVVEGNALRVQRGDELMSLHARSDSDDGGACAEEHRRRAQHLQSAGVRCTAQVWMADLDGLRARDERGRRSATSLHGRARDA